MLLLRVFLLAYVWERDNAALKLAVGVVPQGTHYLGADVTHSCISVFVCRLEEITSQCGSIQTVLTTLSKSPETKRHSN